MTKARLAIGRFILNRAGESESRRVREPESREPESRREKDSVRPANLLQGADMRKSVPNAPNNFNLSDQISEKPASGNRFAGRTCHKKLQHNRSLKDTKFPLPSRERARVRGISDFGHRTSDL